MRYSDKVVYQIYPKSFYDSNGDGLGDIRGMIEKLDYLQELGVDYIWSTPFFCSPQRDNGYDVADYYQVDPAFGSMEDVEDLIAQADKRGIGLMFDMVFNHTSTDHVWFQRALAGDEKYQSYYIFREGEPQQPPTNWQSKFGGSAWAYVPSLGKWYLHLFDKSQADVNWDNPDLREEYKEILRFWKKKGVKGFRFDVVNLISKPEQFTDDAEGDGRRFYTDGPHVHEYLQELVADAEIGDMITVGEMSSTTIDNCIRYSAPKYKELSMCFNFHHLKVDYKGGDKWALAPVNYEALNQLFRDWQMGLQREDGWNALFWCNHDQPRIVSRLGDEGVYWAASAKMLATTIHMMRGTPYIYQGEEIGMTNAHYRSIDSYRDVESLNYFQLLTKQMSGEEALAVLAERSRDNSRTPMQWENAPQAGFSRGEAWLAPADNLDKINVASQVGDKHSILSYYKSLIALRKAERVIQEGQIDFDHEEQEQILSYVRRLGQEEIRVLCHWREEPTQISLEGEYEKILGNYEDREWRLSGDIILKPYEAIVMRRK